MAGTSFPAILICPVDFVAMRALISGVFAMVEAVAVALATLLIVALFAFLVWWLSFGLAAEPITILHAVGGIWLLTHFVPLAIDVSAPAMQLLGFAAEPLSFSLSLAPFGLTLVTVVFAMRSGWRFGNRGGSGAAGVLGGAIGFGIAAGAVSSFSVTSGLPLVATALIPAAVYGASSAAAYLVRATLEQHEWIDRSWNATGAKLSAKPHRLRAQIGEALRLGAMLVAGYIGLAALGVACALILKYANVIAATQALQIGIWGAIMLFALQVALLPVFVVWAGAWLTGAGFGIGLGSSVSPFDALLGPVPALPAFAAIPDGWGAAAALAPVLLALVGVWIGVLHGRRSVGLNASGLTVAATVVLGAAGAGLAIALLTWIASGSLGPGRLAEVGADVWVTAGLAAAELGIGGILGAFAGRADFARLTAGVKTALPHSTPTLSTPTLSTPAFPTSTLTPFNHHVDGGRVEDGADDQIADDQITEPIEPLDPLDPLDPRAYEPPAPIPLPIADGTDDQITEPIDPITQIGSTASPVPSTSPVPPVREPELFDQSEVGESEESTEKVADELTETSDAHDPLVEAFSWDAPMEDENPVQNKRGWRFPGRRG